MQIVNRKLHELWPYANNARTHDETQISQIAASIKEFGFNVPILIDQAQTIIAGHGRLLAAKKLGLTEVPTIQISHLTEAQRKAYIIADNKLTLNGGWDFGKLKDELKLLDDPKITGFSDDELKELFKDDLLVQGDSDQDEAPEPRAESISRPGDLWLLGSHRVYCGDSTVADSVGRLLSGDNPILMVTDPPYGVAYNPEWREDAGKAVGENSRGQVENDNRVDWTDAYSLFSGHVAYIWHAGRYSAEVAAHLATCDFEIISQIIWAKQHFAISRGDYHWQHEPCWYAVKKGHKHNWQGARDQSTIWEIKNNNAFGNAKAEETWGHGTQKPLECMMRPIVNNTNLGEGVYDPFGGSGTTLIACEKTNRKCYMMEIAPAYVDVIVRRWEKFTGKDAILDGTNQTFKELESERRATGI